MRFVVFANAKIYPKLGFSVSGLGLGGIAAFHHFKILIENLFFGRYVSLIVSTRKAFIVVFGRSFGPGTIPPLIHLG